MAKQHLLSAWGKNFGLARIIHEFEPGRRNIISANELCLSYPEHHDLPGGSGWRSDTWLLEACERRWSETIRCD